MRDFQDSKERTIRCLPLIFLFTSTSALAPGQILQRKSIRTSTSSQELVLTNFPVDYTSPAKEAPNAKGKGNENGKRKYEKKDSVSLLVSGGLIERIQTIAFFV